MVDVLRLPTEAAKRLISVVGATIQSAVSRALKPAAGDGGKVEGGVQANRNHAEGGSKMSGRAG